VTLDERLAAIFVGAWREWSKPTDRGQERAARLLATHLQYARQKGHDDERLWTVFHVVRPEVSRRKFQEMIDYVGEWAGEGGEVMTIPSVTDMLEAMYAQARGLEKNRVLVRYILGRSVFEAIQTIAHHGWAGRPHVKGTPAILDERLGPTEWAAVYREET
jgi:hypothetical protein